MSILNYFKNNDELLTEKKKFHTNELLVSIGSFANEPNEPLVPIGINSLDDIDIYTDGACSNKTSAIVGSLATGLGWCCRYCLGDICTLYMWPDVWNADWISC